MKPSVTAQRLPTVLDIDLWLVDLRQALGPSDLAALSDAEHQRAARFRFEHDARRYRVSHVALRQILAQALGIPTAQIELTQPTPHDKPRLVHADLHFNLSHSGDWALIGLTSSAPIGVDLELIKLMPDADTLARRHFTGAEYADFAARSGDGQRDTFLRCWTRKEACLKALGTGLSIEPHVFEASAQAARQDTVIDVDGHRCTLEVISIELPVDALAAVAKTAPGCPRLATM